MFSYEKRKQAVELLIQYDMQYTKVVSELGYPSINALRKWFIEFKNEKKLHKERKPGLRGYTNDQKEAALQYYNTHGKSISKAIRAMGYPCREVFEKWLDEICPNRKKVYSKVQTMVEYTPEYKRQAVIDLCSRSGTAKSTANKQHVSRTTLYKWVKELLGQEYIMPQKADNIEDADSLKATCSQLEESVSKLKAENAELEAQRFRLQLEVDLLTNAEVILKKEKGVSLQNLSNREKAELIDTLRNNYRLKILLKALKISKSSYCYQENALEKPDKYKQLRQNIKDIFESNYGCYGYRRIWYYLRKQEIIVSEKVIRRIMREQNLIVPYISMRKYSSYAGEISPAVANLVERNFHAEQPNRLWLTDITEFHIPAGKVYLSPMIDCFDGLPVSWAIETSPNAELANRMLRNAIATLKDDEHPIVHSDRGAHYRWPEWIKIMEDSHLTRSMSRKGYSPDNAACEGFHGRLKNEFFYERDWQGVGIDEFIQKLNDYLTWYANERIKITLNGMSPIEYRKNLKMVI